MYADLHLHTRYSDGTYTLDELLAEATRHQLTALALTDHDTIEGCAGMQALCVAHGLEFLTGVELTSEFEGHEVHLLGYGVDIRNRVLLEQLARFQAVRQNRIREMVMRLNDLNVPLRPEVVFDLANCRSPGRPHVGRALVEEGFCANLNEAFDRYLKRHRPAWVPKFKMSSREAIDLIHQAGGLAVVAHPGIHRSDLTIGPLSDAGLDGLECFHSRHTPADCERYLSLARDHHLLITGGSDCHGYSKGKPTIGSVKLACEYFSALKARLSPAPATVLP